MISISGLSHRDHWCSPPPNTYYNKKIQDKNQTDDDWTFQEHSQQKQGQYDTLEHNYPTTPSAGNPNTTEAQEKDPKTAFMSMIEVFKEQINRSLRNPEKHQQRVKES